MELEIITSAAEKANAQALLKKAFEPLGGRVRTITFRPSFMREHVFSIGPGRIWAAFQRLEDEPTPRYWNGFGILPAGADDRLELTVECNVPFTGNERRAKGFFARDLASGHVLLMHDGGIGGGREGVGAERFLAWRGDDRVEAKEHGREPRRALVLADLDGDDVPVAIERFVQDVAAFKRTVRER